MESYSCILSGTNNRKINLSPIESSGESEYVGRIYLELTEVYRVYILPHIIISFYAVKKVRH